MAQQFQVPQFIEREAKLIGPFTLKQSFLLGAGGAMLFVLWFIVEKWLFLILAFPIALLMMLLAFLKINGRPLVDFFASFFSFFISPQLFIWQKRREDAKHIKKKNPREVIEKFSGPSIEITKQGIRDLAKQLDRGS